MKNFIDYLYNFIAFLGWFWLTIFIWVAIFHNGRVILDFTVFNELILEFIIFNIFTIFLILYPLKNRG